MNRHITQNWAAVPFHLLQKVFTYCSVIDRISAERVCSHWKTAMSYADMTMIDLKEVSAKIKKQDLEISNCEEHQSSCVIRPGALTLCLDFLNKRKRITRLTCSPDDGACGNYSCLMHTKLPYLPGYHAEELLDEMTAADTPAKCWMLDMSVLDFLARECGDTLESLDLTHCAVDDPTLATLHSQGFPRLVEYSSSGVNEKADQTALSLNLSSFPALQSLSLTLTTTLYATVLPTQLTTLRLIDLENHGECFDLCFLEQCPHLEELYLINFYFLLDQFVNEEFQLENLKTLCFKQTSNKQWHDFGALKEILGVSPALHTFYWGMAEKNDDGPSPNACYFDPYEMFKSTRNLKVLGLSCTDMLLSKLDDLLICFPHLQALSLDCYGSQSLKALSKALVNGALQLEELNLLSYFNSSLNSLSVLPNLKRIRLGRRFTRGVTAAALSKLPTTVNRVTIDDYNTSRVLRIPPHCSDRRSLFANFLARSTTSQQNNIKRKRNSGSNDKASTSQNSDSDAIRVKCRYGRECYRRNPVHKDTFSHPGDVDWRSSTDSDSDDAASKKPEKKIKRRKK